MAGLPVSLPEVLDAHARTNAARTFTGLPAEVRAYDPATNQIIARIVVKAPYFNSDGEREFDQYPDLAVPVMWPRGGGKAITFPLLPGDFVWLVFSSLSLAEWRLTGQLSEPVDARRHSIGYPYAIPGAFPDVVPLNPTDLVERAAGAMIVGDDGGPVQMIFGGTLPGVRFGKLAISPVALAAPLVTYVAALAAKDTADAATGAAVAAALNAIQGVLVAIATALVPTNPGLATPSAAPIATAAAACAASDTAAGASAAAATVAAGAVPSTLVKSL